MDKVILPEFNILSPESESSKAYAEILMEYISDGTAAFDDPSIPVISSEFYDWKKDQYRKHNGLYMFILPGSVLRKESNTVRREKIEKRLLLDKISHPITKAISILLPIKSHSKIKWNKDNTAEISSKTLQELEELMY